MSETCPYCPRILRKKKYARLANHLRYCTHAKAAQGRKTILQQEQQQQRRIQQSQVRGGATSTANDASALPSGNHQEEVCPAEEFLPPQQDDDSSSIDDTNGRTSFRVTTRSTSAADQRQQNHIAGEEDGGDGTSDDGSSSSGQENSPYNNFTVELMHHPEAQVELEGSFHVEDGRYYDSDEESVADADTDNDDESGILNGNLPQTEYPAANGDSLNFQAPTDISLMDQTDTASAAGAAIRGPDNNNEEGTVNSGEDHHTQTSVAMHNNSPISLLLAKHHNLGTYADVTQNDPAYQAVHEKDDAKQQTRSMLRLIDFCDQSGSQSRRFMDGLLRLLNEEESKRSFHKALAPTRETFVSNMMTQYGEGLEPLVTRFRIATIADPTQVEEPDHLQGRDRDNLDCISFNIQKHLEDLLDDKDIFGNLNNLVVQPAVNADDVNACFRPYSLNCSEVNGGNWYRETLKRLKDDPEDPFNPEYDFFMPLILYCDKTGTADNQRYPLEPVLFTTSVIRLELRSCPRTWRPAGYIPDLESKSTHENKYVYGKNPAAVPTSYHRFFGHILDGFARLEEKGFVKWLRLGNRNKLVRIRPHIAYIIGDGKSRDMLTGRQGGHRKGATRISSACMTGQLNCSNVIPACRYVTVRMEFDVLYTKAKGEMSAAEKKREQRVHRHSLLEMHPTANKTMEDLLPKKMELIALQKFCSTRPDEFAEEAARYNDKNLSNPDHQLSPSFLERLEGEDHQKEPPERFLDFLKACKHSTVSRGFQPINNAFLEQGISFGFDPRGPWGGNPTDLMHAYLSGLVMYICKMILGRIGNKKKSELDKLIDKTLGSLRTSEQAFYPRYNFVKGFTKVSNITCDEWMGKLFVIAIAVSMDEGRLILGDRFHNHQWHRRTLPKNTSTWGAAKYQAADQKLRDLQNGKTVEIEDPDSVDSSAPLEDDPDIPHGTTGDTGDNELLERFCSFADFYNLVEAMLAFHAWYKLFSKYWFPDTPVDPDESDHVKKAINELREKGVDCRKTNLHSAIQKLLAMIKCYLPRATGNKWDIQKFHDMLHLAEDMERFGSPKNFDAGPLESALRFWAKFPAKTAQTRGYNTFVVQVSKRIHEYLVLAKARRVYGVVGIRDGHLPSLDGHLRDTRKRKRGESDDIEGDVSREDIIGQGSSRSEKCAVAPLAAVTAYRVPLGPATHRSIFPSSGNSEKRLGHAALPEIVVDFLREQHHKSMATLNNITGSGVTAVLQREALEEKWIRPTRMEPGGEAAEFFQVRTELTFELQNKDRHRRMNALVGVRCHTNYKNQGYWHDWVTVDYRVERSGISVAIPCKVLAFVWDQQGPDRIDGCWKAIVHPCEFQDVEDKTNSGLFFQHWKLNYSPDKHNKSFVNAELDVVCLESIIDRCMVVEQEPGVKGTVDLSKVCGPRSETYRKVVYILPRRLWGDHFV